MIINHDLANFIFVGIKKLQMEENNYLVNISESFKNVMGILYVLWIIQKVLHDLALKIDSSFKLESSKEIEENLDIVHGCKKFTSHLSWGE